MSFYRYFSLLFSSIHFVFLSFFLSFFHSLIISFFILFYKIFYLVYRSFIVSFAQGGTGVPCPPFSVLSTTLLCCLPALPVVVDGGGRVYAWYWGVGGSGIFLSFFLYSFLYVYISFFISLILSFIHSFFLSFLSIYFFISLFFKYIYIYIHSFIYLSIYLSICLFIIYLFIYLFIYLSIYFHLFAYFLLIHNWTNWKILENCLFFGNSMKVCQQKHQWLVGKSWPCLFMKRQGT